MTKHCNKCNTTKSREDFTKLKRSKDGLYSICKSCKSKAERAWRTPEKTKQYNLKKDFDLTPEGYKKMLDEQGGVCAICKELETTVRCGKVQALSVDHCHTTGKIRGLLCNRCNRALGKFKDNIVTIQRALSYLENSHV
jgi:hypothetical protein